MNGFTNTAAQWTAMVITALAAVWPAARTLAADPQPADKPNIIFIMADDLGYGSLGSYGATIIKTPHTDRLANEGMRFTDAHSPSAVCSPTRFGVMTGTYPWRDNRVPRHLHAWETLVLQGGEKGTGVVLEGRPRKRGRESLLRLPA